MEFPDPKYREICDTATLQSSGEGFFNQFASSVIEKVGLKWIDKTFAKEVSDQDKIRICCNHQNVWSAIQGILANVRTFYREKLSKVARDARLQGDQLLSSGQTKKAIALYSQSIIRASNFNEDPTVDDGLTLSLAYKSRATAFESLGQYSNCLKDLNMALEGGFPKPLKYQIYRKMGECYEKIHQHKKAEISLQISLKFLDEQILRLETTKLKKGSKKMKNKDPQLKQQLEKERHEIKELLTLVSSQKLDDEEQVEEIARKRALLPKLTGNPNEKYSYASDLVSIKYSAKAGRFAAASDIIETGATLVVEEPQASCLMLDMFSSHCHHCYSRLDAPIPCKTCSGLAFCSIKCRDDATTTYHKYECKLMGLLIGSGMSALSFLSLRMVTQDGLTFFKQLYEKIQKLEKGENKRANVEFSEKESRYMEVYNLTSHSNIRPSEDYFRRTLMAIFLVKCLKQTEFFGGKVKDATNKKLTEDEILTASLILHHLQVLQFNAHEIYETRMGASGQTRGSKMIYTAVGVYPTAALFNHECEPAVTRYFNGQHIIFKVVRPLKKGETISENYGPIFTKRSLIERTRYLTSRYWFRCTCKACVEDWPLLENLTTQNLNVRCENPNCKYLCLQPVTSEEFEVDPTCLRCLSKTDLLDKLEQVSHIGLLYEKGLDDMNDQKFESAIRLFITFLDQMYSIVSPPCKKISLCQEALRKCYAQSGNISVIEL